MPGARALALAALLGPARAAAAPSSGELLRELDHLRTLGSVLYVAAHPDDENTRLLAMLAGERGLHVTYLSLTRGGGGQNLIGPEQGALLSVIRTDELLAARAIDGADQRFTRARDFGYSKSAADTLATWHHAEVLADVVRVVREVRPDVIITRFGPDDDTHGHHVASAILAAEAFERAADPAFVTEGLAPWRTARLVRNASSWRIGPDTDTSGWLSLDVGGYDPRTGRSWGEVAADARTMHKSQGFGSAPSVGAQLEYFQAVAGDVPPPGRDLFEGLDLGWTRVPGGAAVDKALARARKRFDPSAPHAVLPELARAHALLDALDDPWAARRQADLEAWMADASGLWLTARADAPAVIAGGVAQVRLTAVARGAPVILRGVRPGPSVDGAALAPNAPWTAELALPIPPDLPPTRPHWLVEPPSAARWTIGDGPDRTAPTTPASLQVAFDVEIAGRRLTLTRPVSFARTDRVRGEIVRDVEVLPPVTATFDRPAQLAPAGQPADVRITLRAEVGPVDGLLRLAVPEGVRVDPAEQPFSLGPDAPEQVVRFAVSAAAPVTLRAEAVVDGQVHGLSRASVAYPHLPERTVLQPAALTLVPTPLDRGGRTRIGVVQGSGDEVVEALRGFGYEPVPLDEAAIRAGGLDDHDVVVLGIRAFNTHAGLRELQGALHDWAARGGTLIAQYHTVSPRETLALGPLPLALGRGRVTDEAAAMVPLDPDHPVLTTPNRLGPADFDGWVQERGLYFAASWDPAWTPVFRIADPGEAPQDGALLVLRHGDGHVVYTGLSFFRQLPAGVPGAARLFANLLALGAR